MIAHIAIPANDLEESITFYEKIGAEVGRKYANSVVLQLFGIQLVLHCWDKREVKRPKMYPRHFGLILGSIEELKHAWASHEEQDYVFEPYFIRYPGKIEAHHAFFLKDPSGNLIEFKWYMNREAIFGGGLP